jgi:hypothetical protein
MKKLLLPFTFLLTFWSFGQNVGINSTGTTPHASAGLDVNFSDKGVLIPRVALVSNTDVVTIPSPETSLLVYNTNAAMVNGAGLGFYYWDGSQWIVLGGAAPASSGPVPGQQFYQSGRQVFPGPTGGCATVPCGTTTNWVVPAGITMIRVQLAGAGGGSHDNTDTPSGACGGFVIGEIPVTPGETLTIFAGQGGRGYTTATDPRGGSGSYIARGATILVAAGGGGGSRRGSSGDGNGGGMAFGLSINGGNGTTSAGGTSGNNYVAYLYNSISFIGKNGIGGTINQAGVSARYFTELYNGTSNDNNYGWGSRFGESGRRGVVIIEW